MSFCILSVEMILHNMRHSRLMVELPLLRKRMVTATTFPERMDAPFTGHALLFAGSLIAAYFFVLIFVGFLKQKHFARLRCDSTKG